MTPPTPSPTTRRLTLYAPQDLRLEAAPLSHPATLPVIRVEGALLAGTERKGFERGHPKLYPTYPSLFGHQGVGTVYHLPAGVDPAGYTIGQRVVVPNSIPCGECPRCLAGRPNLCPSLHFVNGAFADFWPVPTDLVTRHGLIPTTAPVEEAVFAQLLAVCLRGVQVVGEVRGKRVLVLGLGPIGMTLAKLARLEGASEVIGMARSPHKRERAQRWQAVDAALALPDLTDTTALPQADVVIEATGQLAVWQLALHLVSPGGVVNFFGGVPPGSALQVSTDALHYQEVTLTGSFHYTWEDLAEAVRRIETGGFAFHELLAPSPLTLAEVPGYLTGLITSGSPLEHPVLVFP